MIKKHPRFGGASAPKPPLARVWAARSRPHIARLWQLLELDNLTGERRDLTYHVLKDEVLTVCVTRYETRKMKAWSTCLALFLSLSLSLSLSRFDVCSLSLLIADE